MEQEFRYIIRIRGCSFPVPGHYEIMQLADGERVAQRKMI